MADATVKQVVDFFGMKLGAFKIEWAKLTDEDKAQLKAGIGNGSLTY